MPTTRTCQLCENEFVTARMKCVHCDRISEAVDQCTTPDCANRPPWLVELEPLWDTDFRFCPACVADPSTRIYRSSVTYPYYDRGLGCEIVSPAHRMRVCREKGVIPTEGETRGLWDEIADREQSLIEKDERKYNDYVEEMTTGPARGEFARMQHVMQDVHREEIARARVEEAKERRQWEREVEAMRKADRDSRYKDGSRRG